ncbi:cytochrome P450 [Tanacetum coccineum]
MMNVLSNFMFSIDLAKYDSASAHEFKDAVWGILEIAGKPNLADFFPIFKPLDPQRLLRKANVHAMKIMAILDRIIAERLQLYNGVTPRNNDVLDLLLNLTLKDDDEFSQNDIRHFVWAMGRDPKIWPNPEAFLPERFLDVKTDYKGQDFELIPFGAGRRICPGLNMAHRMLHIILGSLVYKFDWKLEGNMGAENIDMDEKFRLTLWRNTPLFAIPIRL